MSTSDARNNAYSPIDCDLYDQIELLAIRKKVITIQYCDGSNEAQLIDVMIKTTLTRDGEEFLKLTSGQEIRLDRLLQVDGTELKKNAAS